MRYLNRRSFHGLMMSAILVSIWTSTTSTSVRAQAPATPEPIASGTAQSARLVLLGTGGGPILRLRRAESGNLLVVDGVRYVIDVGLGTLHNLLAAGYRAEDVDAIFITHHHLDHDGELAAMIAQSSAFAHRTRPVTIVGPTGTESMVRASFELFAPSRRIFANGGLAQTPDPATIYLARDIVQSSSPGVIYKDAHVLVTAVENTHYGPASAAPDSSDRDRSYSYRFETGAGTIVFTGDTGPSDAVTDLARGADVLVTEVIDVPAAVEFAVKNVGSDPATRARIAHHMTLQHLTPEEVGKMAATAKVRMVVLTHLSPGADDERTTSGYVDGIRKYYSGPVIVGNDLTEVNFSHETR